MARLNLSAHAYHRILKLARTIADLAGYEEIQSVHLAEALHASQPKLGLVVDQMLRFPLDRCEKKCKNMVTLPDNVIISCEPCIRFR